MPTRVPAAIVIAIAIASISNGAQASDVDRALRALETGDAVQAAALLGPLAEGGDPRALLHFGMLHYNGHGVPENESRAIELLMASARKGNVEAMYQLGNVFTFGQDAAGLVEDPDLEAAKWYHQAAVAGNRDAQYSLGLMFMSGKGVVKDANEAAYWMRQAATAGHPDAKSYVAAGN